MSQYHRTAPTGMATHKYDNRAAVAPQPALAPGPQTVRIELGRDSVAFRLARDMLAALWEKLKGDPAIGLKRQLWAQRLKLVYGREVESDHLFFQHTFLVIVARAVAHAVVDDAVPNHAVLDWADGDPERIPSGWRMPGIPGAIESDVFDWIGADAGGKDIVRRIVTHVQRFDLRCVETDILRVLYESLIDRDQRRGLGEYYTPDWLAAKVVRNAVSSPHEQSVLDPACGSGTFLFHAIRHYLRHAENVGVPPDARAAEATARVAGIDIHPVAVIIARVTCLLALAPVLRARKGAISIPVHLGDALQGPAIRPFNDGGADVVIGNPPWLPFRHMSADLQQRFREMSKGEGTYAGGKFATQNDLCALFAARTAALHLRPGGRIAFVLPLAAVTRGQFEPLRAGSFSGARIDWEEAWIMDDRLQPLFPVPSCVMFGRRAAAASGPRGAIKGAIGEGLKRVRAFAGHLPHRDADEEVADRHLTVTESAPIPAAGRFTGGSAYRSAFRQGATLVPRMLCLVERPSGGHPGGEPAAPWVASRRTTQEKKPWKDLPGVEHSVEAQFLHPVLLGESILPYRVFRPFEGVVPATADGTVLHAETAARHGHAGLHGWMAAAEAIWSGNAGGGPGPDSKMTLTGRWNFHNELGAQFPMPPLRTLYAKAGSVPAACLVRDRSVIDHMLYWSAPASESEGHYLASILNSETARRRSASLQARGQWGARHFDKVMFTLPILRFDENVSLHMELACAGREAENLAATVELPDGVKFQRARKLVRDALTQAGISVRIDELVARLLDGARSSPAATV
jgi:SAM-dependent methyltransferase